MVEADKVGPGVTEGEISAGWGVERGVLSGGIFLELLHRVILVDVLNDDEH